MVLMTQTAAQTLLILIFMKRGQKLSSELTSPGEVLNCHQAQIAII